MSPSETGDTKVCPYCAETIKAAAIKCRYCRSDLTAGPGTEPPAPARPAEPLRTEATGRGSRAARPASEPPLAAGVEEQEPLPAGDDARPRRGFWDVAVSPYATAALAALVAALVVVGIVIGRAGSDDGTASDGQVVDEQVRSVALTQGSQLLQDALSYSYQDFDKVRSANVRKMSPSFRRQYRAAMGKAETKTKRYQVTLKTTVVASGIQSITAHRAKVLLFINQVTSAEKGPDRTPVTQLNRTVVTLERGAGDWRIAAIDPLAGGA